MVENPGKKASVVHRHKQRSLANETCHCSEDLPSVHGNIYMHFTLKDSKDLSFDKSKSISRIFSHVIATI